MIKLVKLPLALLATSALVLLAPGVASAGEDPASTLLGTAGDVVDDVVPGADDLSVVPDQTDGDLPGDTTDATTADTTADEATSDDDTSTGDTSTGDGGKQTNSDGQPPAAPSKTPLGAGSGDGLPSDEDLAAVCADVLAQFPDLPADLDCGGLAECLQILVPADAELPSDLEELTDTELEDLLGELDLDGFMTCVEDLVSGVVTPPVDKTPPAPNPQPVLQPAASETYYQNCDDARARGAAPVLAGQPGYRPGLDSDSDGIGCENSEGSVQLTSTGATARSGQLAYTGFELTPVLVTAAALLALGGGLLMGARRRS